MSRDFYDWIINKTQDNNIEAEEKEYRQWLVETGLVDEQ